MTARRPLRRAAVAAATLLPLLGLADRAAADTAAIPPLCFPVEGPSFFGSPPSTSLATTYWSDTFGAARSGHAHEGEDIMSVRGVKMRHLLAAVAGTIIETHFDDAGGNRIAMRGDDGWYYVYIHVNNDSPGTDDADGTQAQAFAPGISPGVHVVQGQWIGYLGDSGNAETAGAHNHFEVRMPLTSGNANTSYAWSSATAVDSTTALQDAMAHPERCGPASRFAPFTSAAELVDRQYRDFQGRAPDTASRNSSLDRVLSDQETPAALIARLESSGDPATRVAPIARLYKAYFLRTPDAGGLQYWLDQSRAGKTLAWTSNFFAGSQEFTDRYGALDNAAFVNQIYRNVLAREGDPTGIAFWRDKLDTGQMTRGRVMLEFSESPENQAALTSWVRGVVTYFEMLNRAPDPGLESGTAGDDPTTLVNGVLAGDEYAQRVAGLRAG